jgi:hypothetical protein
VLKDLARWVHRSTKARANSKQSSPAEKIILLGRATVRTGVRKSEPLLFLKEMNILSAHRSSNPICPATQSVSTVGFSVPARLPEHRRSKKLQDESKE